jgi:hypothetical protein
MQLITDNYQEYLATKLASNNLIQLKAEYTDLTNKTANNDNIWSDLELLKFISFYLGYEYHGTTIPNHIDLRTKSIWLLVVEYYRTKFSKPSDRKLSRKEKREQYLKVALSRKANRSDYKHSDRDHYQGKHTFTGINAHKNGKAKFTDELDLREIEFMNNAIATYSSTMISTGKIADKQVLTIRNQYDSNKLYCYLLDSNTKTRTLVGTLTLLGDNDRSPNINGLKYSFEYCDRAIVKGIEIERLDKAIEKIAINLLHERDKFKSNKYSPNWV